MNNESPNTAIYSSLMHGDIPSKIDKRKTVRSDKFYLIRFLDIIISLSALIFLFPALLIIGLLVYAQDGGPMFFGQRRYGFNYSRFTCFKFRTMLVNSEHLLSEVLARDPEALREYQAFAKLKKDPRITALGLFLRKTSLDELPQLYNVLIGEMSLVGPRPIISEDEFSKFGRSFRYYTSVLPGLTGLWQISGRSNTSYRRRVALDRLFAQRKSLRLYLYILVMTVPAILSQKGSY
jgi:exopolysaccharide production protein ExoY